MDDSAEVGRQGVARTAYVELLLHKQLGGVAHIALGIADVYHTPRKGHLLNGCPIGRWRAYCLDDHRGAQASGDALQALVKLLGGAVDGVGGSHTLCQGQLAVVEVNGDDGGSAQRGTCDGAKAYHAAADDHDRIGIGHLCTVYRMEAHAHGLYEGAVAQRDALHGYHLLPRHHDVVAHGTVALHTQCLVMLAGIGPTVHARGAMSAVGIGVYGHGSAYGKRVGHIGAHLLYGSTYLVSGDDGQLHHGVAPEEGVEV